MKFSSILIVLNILALIGTVVWLIMEGGWEPIVAIIVSISTLVAQLLNNENSTRTFMKQKGGKGSTNYQSGGNINISQYEKRK